LLDPQLGRLLDHPFEPIELDERHQYDDARRRLGDFERFNNAKPHPLLACLYNFREVQPAPIADFVLLASLDAQNASQMLGFLALQLGLPAPHLVHKKPSTGHNEKMLDLGCWISAAGLLRKPTSGILHPTS